MSETARQVVADVILSPKTASAVSGGTVALGLAEKFQVINWSNVAMAAGATLSGVMIFIQLWRFWDDHKGSRLERRRQHLQIEALEYKARLRREAGKPLRRDGDPTD